MKPNDVKGGVPAASGLDRRSTRSCVSHRATSVRTAAGFSMRLRETLLVQWPFGGERYVDAAARVLGQPVGGAMALSLTALLCAYLLTTLRGRAR